MKCPFCQHENISGARFCAECGFSMHLKICPNPQCGKISNVGVAVCEFCGQAFPKVDLAPDTTTAAPAGSHAPENVPASVVKDKPRTAAWPLIAVAIVAGGLPLLWANRSHLPTPKPWQVSTPDATKAEGAVPAPVVKSPPPIAPAPIPAPADSAVPSSPALVQAPAPAGVDQNSPRPNPETADITTKAQEARLEADDTPKKAAKAPSPKKKPPRRPCTEAMAALGLCVPSRSGQ